MVISDVVDSRVDEEDDELKCEDSHKQSLSNKFQLNDY